MQHLSDFMLSLTLMLMTLLHTPCAESSDQDTMRTCIGHNASLTWDYEVSPFFAIEWRFGSTQIAVTSEETLSQDSIRIYGNYKSRFLLLKNGRVGFNITNVTKDDSGDYTCSLTLKSTDITKELITKLQVTDCRPLETSTKSPDVTTTISTPTPAEDTNILGIVLGVCIPCGVIALVGVSLCLYWRRKGRSLCNHKEAGRGTNSPVSGSDEKMRDMMT